MADISFLLLESELSFLLESQRAAFANHLDKGMNQKDLVNQDPAVF